MQLTDKIETLPYVGENSAQKLHKLGIFTIEDLLNHIPHRFLDYTNTVDIKDLEMGKESTVAGQITSTSSFRTKTGKVMQTAKIADETGSLQAIWVNQPFLLRMLKEGMTIQLFGKLGFWGRQRAFIFPKFEITSSQQSPNGKLIPIYPETEGITSKWLSKRALDALSKIQKIDDFFDDNQLESLSLVDLHTSLQYIHDPEDISNWQKGVDRLAFNELLLLQLQNAFERIEWQDNNQALKLPIQPDQTQLFIEKLPFELTDSQLQSIKELSKDFERTHPMNRLLQGDVGAGKTVIAAFGLFASFIHGYQSVLMAPTQVLATQHYETLSTLLNNFNMRVSLYTGSVEKSGLGKDDVIIGTHALLHRPQLFEKAAVVVIDEQHRFGVRQRAKILENTKTDTHTPHILSMTATPIPRTITLTLYGDLDISLLDTLPKGRKPVKTWVVPKSKRKAAYSWIEKEIDEKGIQAFVVCPFIEESDKDELRQVKAATVEYENWKKIMPTKNIALLHGKLKPEEKDQVLQDFKEKKYDILVTTPVVEVGIDVPNATIMMIEAADRFGLAQLHQLRGRVGRSDLQSYCLLFTETKSADSKKRLKLMEEHNNGQKLAELDLELRGPGEIFGVRQSGLPELKIANWNDFALIKKTRKFATTVAKNQKKYPKILSYYKHKQISKN